ncbi:peptidylprolyl isomerase [Hydrogenimonas sp.]
MITWMQKHRKYLVITIWISTIAFVGAGFVGWGTYQYGSKSKNVAKVGDVPVTYAAFESAYGNLYQQYNQAMGGRLDEATAKRMGLKKRVLQSLVYQALIKNFAKEHGIIVSDEEVQKEIVSIPAFQKNGHFDKSTYLATLKNMRTKPKIFESSIKDELLIKKTLGLLTPGVAPLELEAFGAALFMADKLRYKVFTSDQIKVTVDEKELKSWWEKHKSDYMTPKRYKLAITWITPKNESIDDKEIEEYYKSHRTEFTDKEGKILPLEKVRDLVAKKVALKHTKKEAELAYIALKKGKASPQETIVADAGDSRFSPDIWKAIESAAPGTLLKPKVTGDKYAVIQVVEMILPKPKSFEEAYSQVKADYISKKREELLLALAKKASDDLKDAKLSDYVTRDDADKLPPLSKDEATRFLQQLFSSKSQKGAILIGNKAISYEVVEQKLLDSDKLTQYKTFIEQNAKKIKSDLLQSRLIERLQQKYPIEIYIKETE